MAGTEVKLRRGTTAQHTSFTGAEGECTVDTSKDTLVVHDGTTAGGRPLLREDLNNLANDAVAYAKIQNVSATSRVLGRKTAAAGDIEECTLSEVLDMIGSAAQGDVLYRGASAWARLAAGTSGQYLKTLGAGANPAWADVTGKQTVWIPAGAMVARTTNGAAAGTVETTTNKVMLKTLDFDTATAEYAQFSVLMPKGWDEGTVTFKAVWSHAATTTNFGVAFELAGVALSDTNAGDTAFGTAVAVTDTGGTTNAIYISAESSAVTIGNTAAEGDWVVFQVNRAPANGSDTMAIDARLHGVHLYYTTNAANDA